MPNFGHCVSRPHISATGHRIDMGLAPIDVEWKVTTYARAFEHFVPFFNRFVPEKLFFGLFDDIWPFLSLPNHIKSIVAPQGWIFGKTFKTSKMIALTSGIDWCTPLSLLSNFRKPVSERFHQNGYPCWKFQKLTSAQGRSQCREQLLYRSFFDPSTFKNRKTQKTARSHHFWMDFSLKLFISIHPM